MYITIKDHVGFNERDLLLLANSLMNKGYIDGVNYGLETHGVFADSTYKINLPYAIHICQVGKRKKANSPIVLEVKRHMPII